jgi:hypothetical protein
MNFLILGQIVTRLGRDQSSNTPIKRSKSTPHGRCRLTVQSGLQGAGMSEISREEVNATVRAVEAGLQCRQDVAMVQLQSELRQMAAELKADVHRTVSDHVRWVTGAVTAVVAVGVSIMALMMKSMMNKPVTGPAQQSPVVVAIPVPQSAGTAAAPGTK